MVAQPSVPSEEERLTLPRNIHLFWIVETGLAAIFLCWLSVYLKRGYRDAGHVWPFFVMHGGDFYVWKARFAFVHRLEFFNLSPAYGDRFTYTAPAGLLYALFYPLGGYRCFVVVTLVALLALLTCGGAILRSRGIRLSTVVLLLGAGTFLSYPFWFEWLHGNLEGIVFLIVAAGLIAFMRGNYTLAAVLFAFAGSVKWYPFVFFGLFIKKPLKPFLVGAIVAVMSTVVSLWVLCPSLSVSWRGVNAGLAFYKWEAFLIQSALTPWDHSLYGAIRDIYGICTHRVPSQTFLNAYLAAAACFGLVLFFTGIRKLPVLNQICALTIAAIWLPPTSIDYTLLHLFLPVFLLMLLSIDAKRAGRPVAGLTGCLLCSAILLAPENEVIYRYTHGCGGLIKAVVLSVFLVLTLRFRLELPTEVPVTTRTHAGEAAGDLQLSPAG